jgi:AraC-like DNA-binding protein
MEQPPADAFLPFVFSTEGMPKRDRLEMWREQIGQRVVRSDYDTPDRENFSAELGALMLPNIALSRIKISVPSAMKRTPAMLRDGDDDLVFFLCTGSPCAAEAGGNTFRLEPGGGMLVSNRRSSGNYTLGPMTCYSLRLSRTVARHFAPALENALYRAIPPGDPVLDLLRSYAAALLDTPGGLSRPMAELADRQLRELIAHAVNPAGDPARLLPGGIGSARLRAVLQDISAHVSDSGLNAAAVGRRLGLSGRYVHRLLAAAGLTFSTHVRELRLTKAKRLLTDPMMEEIRISDISALAGFSDLSHFNRAFRARFGQTPKAARRADSV